MLGSEMSDRKESVVKKSARGREVSRAGISRWGRMSGLSWHWVISSAELDTFLSSLQRETKIWGQEWERNVLHRNSACLYYLGSHAQLGCSPPVWPMPIPFPRGQVCCESSPRPHPSSTLKEPWDSMARLSAWAWDTQWAPAPAGLLPLLQPRKPSSQGTAPFSDVSPWACRCICLLPVIGNPPLLDARSLKGLRSHLQALFSGPGSLDSTAGVSQQVRVRRRGSSRMKGPPFLLWDSRLDRGPIIPPRSSSSLFPNNAVSDSSALGNNGQMDPALRNLCLQKSPSTS